MRKELLHIQLIETYLEGRMSNSEKAIFELKINANSTLFDDVMAQKEIINRLSHIQFKKDIDSYHSNYLKHLLYKKLIIFLSILIGVGIICSIIYYKSYSQTKTEYMLPTEETHNANTVIQPDSITHYNNHTKLSTPENHSKDEVNNDNQETVPITKRVPIQDMKQIEVTQHEDASKHERINVLDTKITTDSVPDRVVNANDKIDDKQKLKHSTIYQEPDSVSLADFPVHGKLKDGNRIFYFSIDDEVTEGRFSFKFRLTVGSYTYIITNPEGEVFIHYDSPLCAICIGSTQFFNERFEPIPGIWSIEIITKKSYRGKYKLNVTKE